MGIFNFESDKIPRETDSQFPVFKRDRYCDMVETTNFNPFKITTRLELNRELMWKDMTEIFKRELEDTLSKTIPFGMPADMAISAYAFEMIESYYKTGGYVPKAIVDAIIEEVYAAVKQSEFASYMNEDVDQFKYKLYYSLTHK